jgi:hypothetical protein
MAERGSVFAGDGAGDATGVEASESSLSVSKYGVRRRPEDPEDLGGTLSCKNCLVSKVHVEC